MKILSLLLFLFSIASNADNLTTNQYRKVISGSDQQGSSYLIIQSDNKTEIYSTQQLISGNKFIRSIILTDNDFRNLNLEFYNVK